MNASIMEVKKQIKKSKKSKFLSLNSKSTIQKAYGRGKTKNGIRKTDLIDKKSNFFWLNNKPTIQKPYGKGKTKNGIRKDWFYWQKNQNFFDLIANLPYRRPMEGKKLRMESKKTDFVDQKIKISLT